MKKGSKSTSAGTRTHSATSDPELRLKLAEERFRLFMENVKEYAIFMLDVQGRVIDWNLGAEHVLGYGPEIVGQPFAIFFPPDDRGNGVPEGELKKAAETGQASDDRWHVRKDGSYFWAYGVTTAMRDEQGELKGFAKVLRDSTERKRFEEQLRHKNAALEEADRLKDQFLAMLAHELRNPLAPIFNAVTVLQQEPLSDTGAQVRAIIDRQAHALARLVDDLLDVSRVTMGKIELRRQVVDFRQVVANALEACRPSISAHVHHVSVSVPNTPLWVDADSTRMEQVVANLLNNAIKYTNQGGHIGITLSRAGDQAELRVRDDGMGIPSDFLPRVFDLFAQGDRTLGRAQGGLGVGLTLVRKLVEMHGGSVQAHSDGVGEGSEFVVSLPSTLDLAAASQQSEVVPKVVKPLRIVVVDDSVDAAESLAMVLQMRGHHVITANSARQGLAIVREQAPDVMFLDIGMPGTDGYQLARQLRQMPNAAHAVLVATSGYGDREAMQRGVEAGFDHYLVKPLDQQKVDHLLTMIGQARQPDG